MHVIGLIIRARVRARYQSRWEVPIRSSCWIMRKLKENRDKIICIYTYVPSECAWVFNKNNDNMSIPCRGNEKVPRVREREGEVRIARARAPRRGPCRTISGPHRSSPLATVSVSPVLHAGIIKTREPSGELSASWSFFSNLYTLRVWSSTYIEV